MPKVSKLKHYEQKREGEPFTKDDFNQRKFNAFQEQAPSGCYAVTYKRDIPPKTLPQLGYWYGGIIEGSMIPQLIERGEDVLYEIPFGEENIPIMVNKENCDFMLKALYMASIGKPGRIFSKGNSNIEEMRQLISWVVDKYLPRYKQVYVMSFKEYQRQLGVIK